MKHSWRRPVRWGVLFAATAALACSSDHRSDSAEATARIGGALTSTQARVLGFNGALTGTGADWIASTGSLAGATSPKTEGTQAARTTLAIANGAIKVTAKSIKLSTLGPIGDHASIQVFLPSSLPANGWPGQVALVLHSPSSGVFNQYQGPIALSGSLGAYHGFDIPIAPSVASALSSHTYSDLEITVELTGPDAAQHYVVDGLSFPSGGNAGAGGAGGTGTTGTGAGGAAGASVTVAGQSGTSATAGVSGGSSSSGAAGAGGASGSGAGGGAGCTFASEPGGPVSSIPFSFQLPKGVSAGEFALVATGGALRIDDGVSIRTAAGAFTSVASFGAAASTNVGVGAQLMGLVSSPQGVDLRNGAHVYGRLVTGADLTAQASAVVDGPVLENEQVPLDSLAWNVAFPTQNRGSCSLEPDRAQALDPGSYGDIAIKSRSHLKLKAGAPYYFGSLSFEPQALLEVDNATGPVTIYVRGSFVWSGVLTPTRADTGNVLFGVAGTSVNLQSPFSGILIAPNAALVLPSVGSPGHLGAFFAKAIEAGANTAITLEPLTLGTFCSGPANACSGLCPCGSGGLCDNDTDCATGLVCGANGVRFGRAANDKVCWNPACATAPVVLGCGTPGAACGSVCSPAIACSSSDDCPTGSVCGKNNGDNFMSSAANVCWPAVCESSASANCGDLTSPCGMCFCHPHCDGRACGDMSDDGCGGQCPSTCADHQPGCTADAQCQPGSVCVANGGARVGLSSSVNVCLPARCSDVSVDCGSASAPCGFCAASCTPDCSGRSCGPDPACGSSCGTCSAGNVCTDGGDCEPSVADPPIVAAGRAFEPLAVPPPINDVGATHGDFSVSDLGHATYSIPIEAPPGRQGIEPNLALRYTSATGDGLLGIGWSLEGLSAVARCERRYAFGESPGPVTGAPTDGFCLDGARLIEVARTSSTIEFRTNVESFTKVVALAVDPVAGPTFFRAFTKDGLIRDYGTSNDSSELFFRGSQVKRTWALAKVSDRSGNSMAIGYRAVYADSQGQLPRVAQLLAPTVELLPQRIRYTNAIGIAGDRFIEFDYQPRTAALTGFVGGGVAAVRDQLLSRIRITTAHSGKVRSYELGYETAANGQPRMRSLQECSGNHVACKRPTRFTYFDEFGFEAAEALPLKTPIGMVFDQNADGRDDVLQTNISINSQLSTPLSPRQEGWIDFGVMATNTIAPGPIGAIAVGIGAIVHYINITGTIRRDIESWNQQPFFAQQASPVLTPGSSTPTLLGNLFGSQVADLNADGVPEVFNEFRNIYVPKPITVKVNVGGSAVDKQIGTQWVPFGTYNPPQFDRFLLAADRQWFGDVDGDGIDDFVRCDVNDETHFHYVLSNGHPVSFPSQGADSILDLQGYDACKITQCVTLGTSGQVSCNADTALAEQVTPGFMFDLDGDGAQELIFHDRSAGWVGLFHNGGLHFAPVLSGMPLESSMMFRLDANGDGLPDILRVAVPAGQAQLLMGTGRGTITQPVDGGAGLLKAKGPAFVLDINRDGADDIVYEDPLLGWIGRSVDMRTGTMPIVSLANVTGSGFFADIDKDGVPDLITATSDGSSSLLRRGKGRRQNLLRTVIEGTGRTLDISYDQTTRDGQATYDSTASGPVAWPQRLLPRAPQALVSDYREGYIPGYIPDVQSGTSVVERQFAYHYKAAHSDLAGYGLLGFESRQIVELFPDTLAFRGSTTVTFDNFQRILGPLGADGTHNSYSYPFLGRPVEVRVDYPAVTTGLVAQLFTSRHDDTILTWTLAFSPQNRPFTFLQQSDTSVTEGGADIWREVGIQTVDAFGNTTLATRSSPVDSSSEAVVFSPTGDQIADWLIGLPKTVVRTSTRNSEVQSQHLVLQYLPHTNLVSEVTREQGGDPALQLTTRLSRSSTGNVFRADQIDATGETRSTTIEYDLRELFPLSITNALGQRTQVRIDDRCGMLERAADPNGITVRRAYDDFGILRQVEAPEGGATISYASAAPSVAANGLQVQSAVRLITDAIDGSHSEQDVDALGRPVRVRRLGFAGTPVDQEYAYSLGLIRAVGRPHVDGDSSQSKLSFTYDVRDRELSESYPDGTSTVFQYAAVANLRSEFAQLFTAGTPAATYLTVAFDRNGHSSAVSTDGLGLAVRETDALLHHTNYEYGPFGSIRRITDPSGNLSEFLSDPYGRSRLSSDPTRGTASAFYNAFDEPTHVEDSHGTTTFDFDALGRIESMVDVDGTTRWNYDGTGANEIGRLVSTESPTGVTTVYGYEPPRTNGNNRGLLNRVERHVQGKSLVTTVSYDSASRPELTGYPSASGAPFSVRNHYDAFGNLTSVTDDVTQTRYWSWEEADQGYRIHKETLGNGATTTYDYEPLTGRLASLHAQLGSTVIQDLQYEYDGVGNVTKRKSGSPDNIAYKYDSLDRLTTSRPGAQKDPPPNFSYDAVGNLQNKDGAAYTYSSPFLVSTSGPTGYDYDASARVRVRADSSRSQHIDYTAFDLPSEIKEGASKAAVATFAYDAAGARIAKLERTTDTLYAGDHYREEANTTLGTLRRHNVVYAAGRPIAQVSETEILGEQTNRTTRYLHQDLLGSITAVSRETEALGVETRDYSPFGSAPQAPLAGDDVLLGFTGQMHDPELGLIDMKGRIYDPELGRFLTPDPFTTNPLSQGLNPFAYVENNPTNYVDPSGFTPQTPWWGWVIGGGIAATDVALLGYANGWFQGGGSGSAYGGSESSLGGASPFSSSAMSTAANGIGQYQMQANLRQTQSLNTSSTRTDVPVPQAQRAGGGPTGGGGGAARGSLRFEPWEPGRAGRGIARSPVAQVPERIDRRRGRFVSEGPVDDFVIQYGQDIGCLMGECKGLGDSIVAGLKVFSPQVRTAIFLLQQFELLRIAKGQPAAREVVIDPKKGAKAGSPLTEEEAIELVKRGGDILARDKSTAKRIAEKAGSGTPIWEAPHGPGENSHYHPTGPNGERVGGHVLY